MVGSRGTFGILSWENIRRAMRWSNTHAYFTGGMARRERADMLALRARVHDAWLRTPQADPDYALDLVWRVYTEATTSAAREPIEPLGFALREFVWRLLHEDANFYGLPEVAECDDLSIDRAVSLRSRLASKVRILARFDHHEALWQDAAIRMASGFLRFLPDTAFAARAVSDASPFTLKVIDIVGDPATLMEGMTSAVMTDDLLEADLFEATRHQYERNLAAVMGLSREKAIKSGRAPTLPTNARDQSPRALVATYLAGTPFFDLFATDLPFAIPEASRFEHMHILAGSGHGKTQTLQSLILRDLAADDPPGMVVIDSQGDLIANISRLALFAGRADRLVIIDPRDVDYPPALNMFDVNLERINRYGAADREQILNGAIELYEYFFGSLLGAELTQKQSLVFRYLARLMILIPGATLRTMIDLMDDLKPYRSIIARLPESARMFFEREFSDRQFGETRTQVKRRLYDIIENQTFERMFSAPRNRVDMGSALDAGKIVLVNTAKDFLKGNSSILGRYFIALTLQAALERAAIPERSRRPAFLYIDEASEYFDDNIDNLLIQARKYRLGLVIAHQYLDQLQGGLRASIAANTSIKFAGGVSDRDARAMASDMRSTPNFPLAQEKGRGETNFAAYIRNVTSAAISLSVPFGLMEAEPRMPPRAYEALLAENRARVSVRALAGPEGWASAEPGATARDRDARPREGTGSDKILGSGQGDDRGSGQATDASPTW